MRVHKSWLKRSLSLALALMMVLSCSYQGLLPRAFAAEESRRLGELMEDNTDTAIGGGFIAGDKTISYTAPSDSSLITVNEKAKKITADSYVDAGGNTWKPVSIALNNKGESLEGGDFDGTYTYTTSEKAFSVVVTYALVISELEAQQTIIDNNNKLVDAIATVSPVYSGDGAATLEAIRTILTTDVDNGNNIFELLAKGITNPFYGTSYQLGAEATEAAAELKQQAANGKLALQYANDSASNNVVGYLNTNSGSYKGCIEATADLLRAIYNDSTISGADKSDVGALLQMVGACTVDDWKNLAAGLKKACDILDVACAGNWYNVGELLSETGAANTADVSKSIAKTDRTPTEIQVATADVQYNMAMSDLTIQVVLNSVDENNKLVPYTQQKVITLADGTEKKELEQEIEASGFVSEQVEAWGKYVTGKFTVTETELPDALKEDTTYTVTYTPNKYTIKSTYADDVQVVYYGYSYTLPAHEDVEKAYDYTVVVGGKSESKMQGDVIVVTEDITISRTQGKAYASQTLYGAIASNAGANDKATKILTSGAVNGTVADQKAFFRYPDASIADTNKEDAKVTLFNGTLTANPVDSSWKSQKWVAFTYGNKGSENTFSGNTASWDSDAANVIYKLDLNLATAQQANQILALAKTLSEEAKSQKEVLDRLAGEGVYDNLARLDTMLLVTMLPSVIDNTKGLSDTLKADFKACVADLAATLDGSGKLALYTTLTAYKETGLSYYYLNADEIYDQLEALATILNEMLCDKEHEEGLQILMNQQIAGQDLSGYADKIPALKANINDQLQKLTKPNDKIATDDTNALAALADGLSMAGDVSYTELTASPYVVSAPINVVERSKIQISYVVRIVDGNGDVVDNKTMTASSGAMERGSEITQDILDKLDSDKAALANTLLGADAKHYTMSVDGKAPSAGDTMETNITVYFNYTAKTYTVTIKDEDGKVIDSKNVSIGGNTTVTLPEITAEDSQDGKYAYRYTYNGKSYAQGTTIPLDLANGSIQRETYNLYNENLDTYLEELNKAVGRDGAFAIKAKDADGNPTHIEGRISMKELMKFVQGIVMNGGYKSVSFGDKVFFDGEKIYMQSLIDAMLNDKGFTSDRLIALGQNGEGMFLSTTLTLDNYKGRAAQHEKLKFDLYLTEAPSAMATVASGLASIRSYLTFQAGDGTLDIKLNLPEKIYELYLTALIATGEMDKSNAADIDRQIAYQFLVDYITMITENKDITFETLVNTLKNAGVNANLSGFSDYYDMICKTLTDDNMKVDANGVSIKLDAAGADAVNQLLKLMGMNADEYSAVLDLIDECQAGGKLSVTMTAAMSNEAKTYQALVLDVNASGVTNKFDYTENLPNRAKSMARDGMVVLLSDVNGDVNFGSGKVILDLNGFTINGKVSSSGTLYIVSSSLDTAKVGGVTGAISGNVTIADGTYGTDVKAKLKDGYKIVDGKVENTLYSVNSDGNTAVFTINSDYMNETEGYLPHVQSLAIDIAMDVAMNYFTAASLGVDGKDLYCVNFNDLLALLNSTSKVDDLLSKLVGSINETGITYFANSILNNLLDCHSLATAVRDSKPFVSYTINSAPWAVTLDKAAKGNYLDVSLTANKGLSKSLKVQLRLVGSNKDKLVERLEELHHILNKPQVELTVSDISYANKTINLEASAKAVVNADFTHNENYPMVMAVILANGGSKQAKNLIDAVNRQVDADLKTAFDNVTVAEAIAALKKLNRSEKFADLAKKQGVEILTADAAKLENLFHLILVGGGKVLEKLDVTGNGALLGRWDGDHDGKYTFIDKKDINRTGSRSVSAFTLKYNLTLEQVTFTADIFGEMNCLWGDVNHDGKVNSYDASLIARYAVDCKDDDFVCSAKADVNGDQLINSYDASLVARYSAGCVDSDFVGNK